MPRCFLRIDGADHDVTNLVDETFCYVPPAQVQVVRAVRSPAATSTETMDWSIALYPNLRDPCNNRLMREVQPCEWREVNLTRYAASTSATSSTKEEDCYEQEMDEYAEDMNMDMDQHHSTALSRAQTAPLHHHHYQPTSRRSMPQPETPSVFPPTSVASRATSTSTAAFPASVPSPPASYDRSVSQQSMSPLTPRTPQHRHSTTAVPGDIDSSSSGLRPRINYKSLYTGRKRSTNGKRPSCPTTLNRKTSGYSSCDETAGLDESLGRSSYSNNNASYNDGHDASGRLDPTQTQFYSNRMAWPEDDPLHEEEEQQEEQHHHHHHASIPVHSSHSSSSSSSSSASSSHHSGSGGTPSTMEIAPNVRVPVRPSRETMAAVQSGDYTVATCFVCASGLVCTINAAFVLCPDCQVVSPISYGPTSATSGGGGGGSANSDDTKKDDPYGVSTGLKREWVNEHVLFVDN